MKFHLSDYELNAKDPNAIVYQDAYGNITRLTRADFSSEEEFQKWKKISDDDLHKRHKGDLVEMKHTVPIETLPDSMIISTPSAEEQFFSEIEKERRKEKIENLLSILSGTLSKAQIRRAWLYYVYELSEEEIATKEGVTRQAVGKTLAQVRCIMKPYKNFLYR